MRSRDWALQVFRVRALVPYEGAWLKTRLIDRSGDKGELLGE
jgi:hypothetical protein